MFSVEEKEEPAARSASSSGLPRAEGPGGTGSFHSNEPSEPGGRPVCGEGELLVPRKVRQRMAG